MFIVLTPNQIRQEWVSLWLSKLTPKQRVAVLPALRVWDLADHLIENEASSDL